MDEKARTRLHLHRDNICNRAIYSLCFNLGAAMSRQFKVGDIVNAKEKFAQANEMPIQKVDSYIWVNDWPYSPKAITLAKIPAIEGIKSKRGVEQYKDQFAPWKPGHLVTTGAEEIINLSDLEMYAKSIGNCAIRQMMKEQ